MSSHHQSVARMWLQCLESAQFQKNLCAPAVATQCNCIGPQNGQPVCPCQMRFVKVIDGRYVKTTDLGPAP